MMSRREVYTQQNPHCGQLEYMNELKEVQQHIG